jgi:hypothetical protein
MDSRLAHTGLQLPILLPQPPECWVDKCVSPYLALNCTFWYPEFINSDKFKVTYFSPFYDLCFLCLTPPQNLTFFKILEVFYTCFQKLYLNLKLKSIINLKLIYVYGMMCSIFIHKDIQLIHHHLFKKTSLSSLNWHGDLMKYQLIMLWVNFWTLFWSVHLFVNPTYCLLL